MLAKTEDFFSQEYIWEVSKEVFKRICKTMVQRISSETYLKVISHADLIKHLRSLSV